MNPSTEADEEFDLIVVGSGAAGLTAAVVAARAGLHVIVLEKAEVIGGTTALSGGGVWVPANGVMLAAGQQDSAASALAYLRQVIGIEVDEAAVSRFLEKGPEAIDYLCRHGDAAFATRRASPDYYSDLPDATTTSRALDTLPFDGRLLGPDLARIRLPRPETLLFGGMAVNGTDVAHFRDALRSPGSFAYSIRRLAGSAWRRARHGHDTRLVLGRAMIGRMFRSLISLGVEVRCGAPVVGLIENEGRVTGVRAIAAGKTAELRARGGVIIATGGFGHARDMIERWVPMPKAHLAVGAPETTGDGITIAEAAGAAISHEERDSAYWVPVSLWTKRNGEHASFPHLVNDRAKPGVIAVNASGMRFVNEADSYHDFVRAMHRDRIGTDASPVYLICDAEALKRYGLGRARPWPFPKGQLIRDGYLITARSLPQLAAAIGVDEEALRTTVDQHNIGARVGRDQTFAKGNSAYNRSMGDPSHGPNPCLAPIEHAPFYAVRVYPGNLGTSRGVRIDGDARALDHGGLPISGLYVVGNDADAILQGSYPGPGASLGPALTGGYLAGCHVVAQLSKCR